MPSNVYVSNIRETIQLSRLEKCITLSTTSKQELSLNSAAKPDVDSLRVVKINWKNVDSLDKQIGVTTFLSLKHSYNE